MKRIENQPELVALARELGVRADWHEPDEQEVTARVEGMSFDNAGFWPSSGAKPFQDSPAVEMHVVLQKDEEDVACVNLATLFAWAAHECPPVEEPKLEVDPQPTTISAAQLTRALSLIEEAIDAGRKGTAVPLTSTGILYHVIQALGFSVVNPVESK